MKGCRTSRGFREVRSKPLAPRVLDFHFRSSTVSKVRARSSVSAVGMPRLEKRETWGTPSCFSVNFQRVELYARKLSATRRGFAGWWGWRWRVIAIGANAAMSRCARSLVELAREKPRFGYRAAAYFAGPRGRACEPQASASRVSGGGIDDPKEEAEHCVREHGENSGVGGATAHFSKSARSGAPRF